jgi:uncharacterized protein DUF3485
MAASSLSSTSSATPVADQSPSDARPPLVPDDLGQVPFWRSVVILLLALVIGIAYWFNPPESVQPQAGVVMDLPVLVGDYFGSQGEITPAELQILPKDTEFARRYYDDGQGHQIQCSIVLSGAEQRSIHRPEVCLVGQGWTITSHKEIPVPLLSGHPLTAEELSLERRMTDSSGGVVIVRAFYDYWFVGQNVSTYSEMWRILLSNWDRAIHNRAHRWAYVSVFALITDNLRPDGLNANQTRSLLVNFAKQVVPTFQISEMPPQSMLKK